MAFTHNNLTYVVEALRDSSAVDPIICRNRDGSYSATSAHNVTTEKIICCQADLELWASESLENISDADCAEFAKTLIEEGGEK